MSLKKVFPTGIRTSFSLGFRLFLDCFDELKLIYFLLFFFRNIDCNLYCFLCYCLNKLFSDKKHVTSRKEFIHEKNSFAPGGGFRFVLSGVTTEFSNQSRSGKYVYHFSIRTFLFKSDEWKSSVESQCQYCRLFFTQCSTHTHQNSIISSNLVGWDWRLSGVHAHEGRDRYG